MGPRTALLAIAPVLASCQPAVSSNVTRLGPASTARPPDCAVELFEATPPTYGYVDVARIELSCDESVLGSPQGADACAMRLRADACRAGADTVYSITRRTRSGHAEVRATLGRRTDAPVPASALECDPPCSPGYHCDRGRCEETCDPACEPGFECQSHQEQEGTCVAVCRPACGDGMRCADDRTCQSIPVEAPPVVDAGPPDAAPATGGRRARKRP